jgi:ABC-2 type transport system ATP-binding protein
LTFIASIHGINKRRAMERIGALLDLFGLKDVENELIESLSQGMRQRLLFSASLMHEPRALLVDEPFTGLDPFGVRMLKGLMRDLSSKGTTIFLATHSLHIAEELCHRVGFIQKGALRAIKNHEEIKDFEGGLEGFFLHLGR